jgi:radical SAM superfamily enzyme YgiQ (UPF0313 family)
MKRVLLVSTNMVTAPYPVPPLGLCLVAQSLAAGYELRMFDGLVDGGASLAQVVGEFSPDYVGVSIRNLDEPVMQEPRSYVGEIRDRFLAPLRALTDAPIILGGAGFSIFPDELLDTMAADFGVVGEGEQAMPELLAALDHGGSAQSIPGVVLPARARSAARGRSSGGREPLSGANIPFSHLDRWVDFSLYRERGAYSLQTKRGCPRECIYCTYPAIEGFNCRLRMPEVVVDEIAEAQARLGDVTFELVDSTFNDPRGHAEAICREIIRRGLRVRLRTMGVNPAGVTEELVELMRRAGFAQIDSTPDSASASVIQGLRKNFTVDDLVRSARAVRNAGMPTMWFFLFGGPGETERTVDETLAFIDREVLPDDMVLLAAGLRIYPHTRLHEVALAEGIVAPGESLLAPRFYVSAALGPDRLHELLGQACQTRPNCVPAWQSTPDADMRRRAAELRSMGALDEPMFRTFLRVRRERMGT